MIEIKGGGVIQFPSVFGILIGGDRLLMLVPLRGTCALELHGTVLCIHDCKNVGPECRHFAHWRERRASCACADGLILGRKQMRMLRTPSRSSGEVEKLRASERLGDVRYTTFKSCLGRPCRVSLGSPMKVLRGRPGVDRP